MKKSIIYTIALVMTASCMGGLPPEVINPDHEAASITGSISNSNGTPLEHIMVTLEWPGGVEPNTLYTSSEGKFKAEIPQEIIGTENTVTIRIEDIDGPDNGGEFEGLTDKVMLFQEESIKEEAMIIVLDYRLNLSTPSENSPQS